MIQKRHIAPLLAGFMLLAACNKEQEPVLADTDGVPAGHLKLSVENPRPANGSKPLLDGLYTYWKNGDRVYVNGVESRVRIASSETYIENYIPAPAVGEYYIASTFPHTNEITDFTLSSIGYKALEFNFPSTYSYRRTSDGKVDLGNIPMLAVADRTAGELTFKNLTATVNVAITNGINSNFVVSSVEITGYHAVAGNAKLSAKRTVWINALGELIVRPATYVSYPFEQTVAINFDNTPTSEKTIAYNETLNVPVPICPVPSGIELTVKVTGTYSAIQPFGTIGYASSTADMVIFSRTITLQNALDRNAYVNANVALDATSSSYITADMNGNWTTFKTSANTRHFLTENGGWGNETGAAPLTASQWNYMLNSRSNQTKRGAFVMDATQTTPHAALLIYPDGENDGVPFGDNQFNAMFSESDFGYNPGICMLSNTTTSTPPLNGMNVILPSQLPANTMKILIPRIEYSNGINEYGNWNMSDPVNYPNGFQKEEAIYEKKLKGLSLRVVYKYVRRRNTNGNYYSELKTINVSTSYDVNSTSNGWMAYQTPF